MPPASMTSSPRSQKQSKKSPKLKKNVTTDRSHHYTTSRQRRWCLWLVEAVMRCCQLWMAVLNSYIIIRCRIMRPKKMMKWEVLQRTEGPHFPSLKRRTRKLKIRRSLILTQINRSLTQYTTMTTSKSKSKVSMNRHLPTRVTLCLCSRIRW